MTAAVRININVQDGDNSQHFVIVEPTFDRAVAALMTRLWPDKPSPGLQLTIREQTVDGVFFQAATGETLDACIDKLRKLRADPAPVLLTRPAGEAVGGVA